MMARLLTIYRGLPRRELAELTMLAVGFVITYLLINIAHFRFLEVRVILFSAILDLIVTTIVIFTAYNILRSNKGILSGLNLFLAALVLNFGALVYAIMGPTVIDRSLSIYIVEKLQQRGGAIREDALLDVFVREFVTEYRLMDVRLTEQLSSGTVTIEDGCVRLTNKGELVATATSFYRRHFLPQKRVLLGDVTDDLTNPYRENLNVVNTSCDGAVEERPTHQ